MDQQNDIADGTGAYSNSAPRQSTDEDISEEHDEVDTAIATLTFPTATTRVGMAPQTETEAAARAIDIAMPDADPNGKKLAASPGMPCSVHNLGGSVPSDSHDGVVAFSHDASAFTASVAATTEAVDDGNEASGPRPAAALAQKGVSLHGTNRRGSSAASTSNTASRAVDQDMHKNDDTGSTSFVMVTEEHELAFHKPDSRSDAVAVKVCMDTSLKAEEGEGTNDDDDEQGYYSAVSVLSDFNVYASVFYERCVLAPRYRGTWYIRSGFSVRL